MSGRAGSERGAAAIEMALFLPALVLTVMGAVFLVGLTTDYSHLNEVSQRGARYATRAALDPTHPGEYRFRPTAAEVEAYVHEIAGVPVDVTVTPDPSTAYPGDEITVTVSASRSLGPVGAAANAVAGLVGGDGPFPDDGVRLTVTAAMREE